MNTRVAGRTRFFSCLLLDSESKLLNSEKNQQLLCGFPSLSVSLSSPPSKDPMTQKKQAPTSSSSSLSAFISFLSF